MQGHSNMKHVINYGCIHKIFKLLYRCLIVLGGVCVGKKTGLRALIDQKGPPTGQHVASVIRRALSDFPAAESASSLSIPTHFPFSIFHHVRKEDKLQRDCRWMHVGDVTQLHCSGLNNCLIIFNMTIVSCA